MSAELLAFLSGLFGLAVVGREVGLIIRTRQVRISNLFLIMYGVTYGIVLSLLLLFEMNDVYKTSNLFLRFDYSAEGLGYSAWWFLAAVVGYFSFRFAGTLRLGIRLRNHQLRPQGQDTLLDRLQITSVICLVIGSVCFVIWANGWGGYRELFLNAAAIRSGTHTARNSVAFFAKPAQVVATVSMISAYLVKQRKNIALNVVLFAISFVLSLLYYLAKDGRMVLAMYFLIVIFMWNGIFEERQAGSGKQILSLLVCFVLFVLVILNMDRVTHILRYDAVMDVEEKTALESIMDELLYIYVAGQTSVEHCFEQGSPFLIGHELLQALFAWVPTALTPKGLIDIWDYNTYLIAGNRSLAQFPSDLISTSLYDLGLLGPMVLPAFWGAVISKLERIRSSRSGPIFTVVYYSLAMSMVRAVNYSMLSATVAGAFHIFVAAVVFWFVNHIKWR